MTEIQPKVLSAETIRLQLDPSDEMRAALVGFYNDKHVVRASTVTFESMASFNIHRLDTGETLQDPPAREGPDYSLARRMITYRRSLEAINWHQTPLTASFRVGQNKRGDVRLVFRVLPSAQDKAVFDGLDELDVQSDPSIELFAHVYPLQRVVGHEAIMKAGKTMSDLLGVKDAHAQGISTYRAERMPTPITKRLFVTGARLGQTALFLRSTSQPVAPVAS